MEQAAGDSLRKENRLKPAAYFLGSLVIALGLTFLLKEPSFTTSQLYVLFLLFFAIGLWVTEAIPAFAVGLFILAYLVYTMGNPGLNPSPEKIDRYVNTFSSSIIWLLLGAFFLASAMTKTGLDVELLKLTLRISGSRPANLLLALMVTTFTASMLMSYTATTAMVIAALTPLLKQMEDAGTKKALLLGVAIAAATGGMGTIIASSTNAISAGLIEESGVRINFLQWMLYGLPLVLILNLVCYLVLVRLYIRKAKAVTFQFLEKSSQLMKAGNGVSRNIVLAVIVVTVLFWLTGSVHGITVAAISAIPIVMLTLTGVLTAADMKRLPWDTLFMIAGGLSLGEAIESTGILDIYALRIREMHMTPFAFLLLLAYLSMIFSNVMSNVATCMLLIPMGMAILPGYKAEVGLSVGLAASAAIFLPVSTPPNLIVYSTGYLKQGDFRTGGLLVGLLGPLLVVLWVLLLKGFVLTSP